MSEPPQLLLEHHLKKLKLPTFQSEHAKLARQCAAEATGQCRHEVDDTAALVIGTGHGIRRVQGVHSARPMLLQSPAPDHRDHRAGFRGWRAEHTRINGCQITVSR